MNAPRRKALESIKSSLADLQLQLETIRDEEQEYYDNMPEGIQMSEKGEKANEAVSSLEDAINNLEDVVSQIETATE